ncbi:MAG TPA: proline dehydrogenase family protein, partial [Acidimicrobiales bacterium]|nr:proline dehydrogenase family protein [Acidimicrobiales bacterium]
MPGIRLREDGTERSVREIALQLSRLSSIKQAGIYHLSWWSDRVLDWAMSHDEFKTRLFRLVDTYPSLGNNNDLVADYLEQYFSGIDIPPLIELGLAFTDHVPGGHRLSSAVTRHNIERIARQFISGSNATQAGETVRSLWRNGIASTVDLLGEHTCSQSEADAYAARLSSTIVDLVASTADLQPDDHLERDDTGPIPPLSVSVKCSALTPHFYPLAIDRAVPDIATRLLPILKLAIASNFSVFLDMEAYETKEIIHTVFEEVATNPLLQDLHLGIVVQAYCKDALR